MVEGHTLASCPAMTPGVHMCVPGFAEGLTQRWLVLLERVESLLPPEADLEVGRPGAGGVGSRGKRRNQDHGRHQCPSSVCPARSGQLYSVGPLRPGRPHWGASAPRSSLSPAARHGVEGAPLQGFTTLQMSCPLCQAPVLSLGVQQRLGG